MYPFIILMYLVILVEDYPQRPLIGPVVAKITSSRRPDKPAVIPIQSGVPP